MTSKLFGSFHVTPSPTALREARNLFPKFGDYQELRKHALKLAFWPGSNSQVGDLNWEEIIGMKSPHAFELRIDDTIGGFNNLRVIFYVHNHELILPGDELPRLWTIGVMQKKTNRFSPNLLKTFAAQMQILKLREYGAS